MDDHFNQEEWDRRTLEGFENAKVRSMLKKVEEMELAQKHHKWLRWVVVRFLQVLAAVFSACAAGYTLFKSLWDSR
jgi:hypothetical protein